MQRFTGEFQGECKSCGEHVEFALGIQTGRDPVAMHFGPGGPTPVELREVDLVLMVDEALDVKFRFACPLCGGESRGRTTCNPPASG